MGYTKKYFLQRVREVNEVYLEHNRRGVSNEYIYENYIKHRFHISRSTFYDYLTIPYVDEMRKMVAREAAKKRQNPTLFDEENSN